MTASATAVALRGRVVAGERIEVRNRGGRVFCTTELKEQIVTRLEGNATFEWCGEASFEEGVFSFVRK
jgi:diaminopimelate epimerase